MKSNKAPEKIYLQVCGDCNANDCENCKFEDLEDNVTWCKDKIFDNDIEYTRTDAFIRKIEDYLKSQLYDYLKSQLYDWVSITNPDQRSCANVISKEDFIEDFKNYMKGE